MQLISGLEWLDSTVQMPLMALPMRTVIVPLAQGRVMLSPGSALTAEELQRAGPVTDVVAPTLFHLSAVKAAAAVHPKARLWGPRGCKEKEPRVAWTHVLEVDPWPYEDALSLLPIGGIPRACESALFHRASRTLLVSDLVFNVTEARGAGAWLILSMFGTWRKLGVSRLYSKLIKDRAAFDASIARVMKLDFDNLVPSHGEAVLGNARAKLLEAFEARRLRA